MRLYFDRYTKFDTGNHMNGHEELFMLEIEPNNGILYEPTDIGHADIVMEYDPDGHSGFLGRTFRSVIIRERERKNSMQVEFHGGKDACLCIV